MTVRNRSILLAAGTLGLALSACGSSPAPSTSNAASTSNSAPAANAKAPTVVTFWESHSAANQQGRALAKIVASFNAANPGIRVEVNVTPASAKALAAVQAGNPPVMAMIGHAPQYGYERAGALVSMSKFVNGPNGFPPAQLKSIWPGVWSAERTPSGQQYLFPVDVKVAEFFYNANLWKQAGLGAVPTTWSQLEADAATIHAKTGAIGLAVRLDHNDWLPQFYSNGGQYFQPGSSSRLALDSPAMATTISQLVKRDRSPGVTVISGYDTSLADFGSGKVGILENTADGYEMVREDVGGKFPVGVFGAMTGTTGKAYTLYQGLSFVIFSHATSAQQQAAWRFIKYFDSPAGQAVWSVIGGEPPISAADVPAVKSLAGPAFAADPGPYAGTAVAIAELEAGTTIHKILGPDQSAVDTVIQDEIQKVLQNGLSPQVAMKTMDSQGDAILSGQVVP
jgi:multiple sugar transport system substrate-binding protein